MSPSQPIRENVFCEDLVASSSLPEYEYIMLKIIKLNVALYSSYIIYSSVLTLHI